MQKYLTKLIQNIKYNQTKHWKIHMGTHRINLKNIKFYLSNTKIHLNICVKFNKFFENIKIIIWLHTNTGANSKNYNKIHRIQTSKIEIFEKHNYIHSLKKYHNTTLFSHKNIHIPHVIQNFSEYTRSI